MSKHLLTSTSNGILLIEFNRPDKKNALTFEMYGLAADALESANDDRAVRAIIFTGKGDCFTSGNDLADFLSATEDNIDQRLIRFLTAVPNCSKPIIAAVQGHAVGIGTTLLLHCDLVYAENNAKLQLPFVNLGLCPEFGSSLLLPQLVGQRRAAELLLLGEPIDAQTACDYGLLNAVVEDALGTALQQAKKLAAQPAAAIRLTRSLLHRENRQLLLDTIEMEGIEFARCMQSPEAKESMMAFMERRVPNFSQFD